MTFKRIAKPGKRGQPQIQIGPEDLEHVRQLALAGRSIRQIADECGVSMSGWRRLEQRHPVLRTIVDDAHASISYTATVESRRAQLAAERGEAGADIDAEVMTVEELDQVYAYAKQGLPLHVIGKKLGLPDAMWRRLQESDARCKAVHQKGIASAASEIARPPAPPAPSTTPTLSLSIHPLTLQWTHAILLTADELEQAGNEPEEAARWNTMYDVAVRLADTERLSEAMHERLLRMSLEDLREMLATMEPDEAADELAAMMQ